MKWLIVKIKSIFSKPKFQEGGIVKGCHNKGVPICFHNEMLGDWHISINQRKRLLELVDENNEIKISIT